MLGSKLGSVSAHLPIRLVGVLPPALAVWWKRSVKLGIFTHCAMNLLGGRMHGQLMRQQGFSGAMGLKKGIRQNHLGLPLPHVVRYLFRAK